MSELDVAQIITRSTRGMIALVQRSFLLQIISAVATFILAYYLDSSIFGVFAVVNAVIGFLAYFSDVGLAAALIQKKEALTDKDLSTTFTIQQILVGIILTIGFLGTPLIQDLYHLDQQSTWLYWSLLVSFIFSSLKTIPSILLERKLEFQKLVIPQIIETLVFNIVTVFLAWKGYGITSFTWGILLRGVTGFLCMYAIAPWRFRFGISKSVASTLFRFGIPFQSNSLLALVKDDLLFLVLGRVLTLEQIGFIFLGKRLSELPLRTVMDNVMRVTFPAFSRLQHDSKLLVKALEKTTFGIALIVFPLYVSMIFFIQPFMELVPRYQKWEGALLSFYFLCVTSIAASLSTPLTNALNAIGKIKITLGLMVMWIVLTWMLVLTFIQFIGYHGFAMALMVISWTLIVVVVIVKRYIPIQFIPQVSVQAIAAVIQGILFALLVPNVPHTFLWLFVVGVMGIVTYATIVFLARKEQIYALMNAFRKR